MTNTPSDLVPALEESLKLPERQAELTALVPHQPGRLVDDPEAAIEAMVRVAKSMRRLMDQKKKPIYIDGEEYLEYEDWQMLGRFFGLSPKIAFTRAIRQKFYSTDGKLVGIYTGFRARAVAVHVATGIEWSAGESQCTNQEDHWRSRPVYGYEHGKRVQVATAIVPQFELRGMAQTRACARALRNATAGVVRLMDNVADTPAEEMPNGGRQLPLTICSDCGEDLYSKKDIDDSRKQFNKTLCRVCQKMAGQRKAAASAKQVRYGYEREATGTGRAQPIVQALEGAGD